MLLEDERFDDALTYATLAFDEANKSADSIAEGKARTGLAEVYDGIGMMDEAKDEFVKASERLQGASDPLAHTYLQYGIFLVDQESEQARRDGLEYLDLARDTASHPEVSAKTREDVEFSARLNAASAHADLGERAAAEAELAGLVAEDLSDDQYRTMLLTRGFLAARADRLEEAEQLFAAADAKAYGIDTGWWTALELARAYRRAGRVADAERYLRAAIAIVEDRRNAGSQRLRPFLLSRRASAYTELVALLVEQQRGLDALVVVESLHARTWLDTVLGADARRLLAAPDGAREAALRLRQPAFDALDAQALLAALGDREALVLLRAGDTTWRFHVDRQRVEIASITAADLAAILAFRDHPDDQSAAELAAHALLPRTLIERTDPLIVVANGDLVDVPFAALPLGGARLVNRRAVVRVPGLAALGCRPRSWTSTQLFVGDAAGNLPQAAAEVRRLGGGAARVGGQATRFGILFAPAADLLHIAVHGTLTDTGGALELADGRLTTTDILDARIGPRVVMLTGCATGASVDAEAWTGFPSAFLASGSQHVIATLRSVYDTPAATMVTAYYAQPSDLSPPERLAAAQRAVASTSTLEVKDWSAFAAWGDAACGR